MVRFLVAGFAAFRDLPRLAEFPLRSFRFCIFDPFLRLAMIAPLVWLVRVTGYPQGIDDQTTNGSLSNLSNEFFKSLLGRNHSRFRQSKDIIPEFNLLASHQS